MLLKACLESQVYGYHVRSSVFKSSKEIRTAKSLRATHVYSILSQTTHFSRFSLTNYAGGFLVLASNIFQNSYQSLDSF